MTCKFSIIVPAYNFEAVIGETIESVLAQTLPDWELVLVDDGSADATVEVARRYDDPRIQLIEQKNQGSAHARNVGLSAAKGAFVVFLDGDDRLRPDALARFKNCLTNEAEAAVAYGDRVYLDEAGTAFGSERGAILTRRPVGDVLKEAISGSFITTPGQGCVRRAALDRIGGWPLDLPVGSDWCYWCRLAASGPFAHVGPGPVLEYRIRQASMSHTFMDGQVTEPHIREMQPTIESIFATPQIAARFDALELAALRPRAEASVYAFKGTSLLRKGAWGPARRHLWQTLRRDIRRPREALLWLLAALRWVPGPLRRYIGLSSSAPTGPRG